MTRAARTRRDLRERPYQRDEDRSNQPPNRSLLMALLPLRFFVGGTFVYAGLDKLLFDPSFLREAGAGSIMQQLQSFTRDSPLTPLIQAIALPHPLVIGGLMAVAEIGIGLGVVLGIFYRPAALLGFLTAMLFFLTASWGTHPYYFGPDLPYAAGFLTLALVGQPGPYSVAAALDRILAEFGLAPAPPAQRSRARGPETEAYSPERRAFLQASVLGALAVIVGGAALSLSRFKGLDTGTDNGLPGGGGGGGGATPAPGTSGSPTGNSIGTVSQISQQGSIAFNDPSTGDPAYAIQVNGQVQGYDAICTHQGCQVQYFADQKVFACPCHGGEFDATHQAQVIAGPPPGPLRQIQLTVDGQGNVFVQG